jgi:Flp pilus assembly pilin Flp
VLTLGSRSIVWFNAVMVPYALIALFLAVAMTAYYLAWKYIVGFVNRLLGIA